MIARLTCWLLGHRRGKRVATTNAGGTFECRRCGEQWTRKDRKAKAA